MHDILQSVVSCRMMSCSVYLSLLLLLTITEADAADITRHQGSQQFHTLRTLRAAQLWDCQNNISTVAYILIKRPVAAIIRLLQSPCKQVSSTLMHCG